MCGCDVLPLYADITLAGLADGDPFSTCEFANESRTLTGFVPENPDCKWEQSVTSGGQTKLWHLDLVVSGTDLIVTGSVEVVGLGYFVRWRDTLTGVVPVDCVGGGLDGLVLPVDTHFSSCDVSSATFTIDQLYL